MMIDCFVMRNIIVFLVMRNIIRYWNILRNIGINRKVMRMYLMVCNIMSDGNVMRSILDEGNTVGNCTVLW